MTALSFSCAGVISLGTFETFEEASDFVANDTLLGPSVIYELRRVAHVDRSTTITDLRGKP